MTRPVELRGAHVTLAGRPVVRGVDLRVSSAEFVALLGTNGSGKSTLMRAALGLLPAEGTLELFGVPVGDFSDWARIGYVPQRSTATSGVPSTVREVVTSGRLARRPHFGFPSRADRAAVDEALELVGLADRARESAAELSGGQQQRVMIARGLASQCDLLVMDEPTAGVDRASQAVLADALSTLPGQGRSIWMIAHELGPFEPLIDRTVVLRDGVVTYDGPSNPVHAEADHHHPHDASPTYQPPVDVEGAWRQ